MLIALLGLPGAASAQPVSDIRDLPCEPYPAEGRKQQEVCSGEVLSFDGAVLDVDVTKPIGAARGQRHPLMLMLHGFSNDKHEWEWLNDEGDGADKWHWNSHWFAEHGYYVVTYTARGFRTDRDEEEGQPETPPGTSASEPNGTNHLKSKEFEAHDTQWLAALVAKAFPDVAEDQVAVTGGSYGGGESWLQASQAEWSFPSECSRATPGSGTEPGTGPEQCRTDSRPDVGPLDPLQLQVAVPKYPWTDLGYSLAPNGHPGPAGNYYDSATHHPLRDDVDPCFTAPVTEPPGDRACNPIGTLKFSYTNGFYALGNSDGVFEHGGTQTPSQERTQAGGAINVHCWKQRADGGALPLGTPSPATCVPPGDPYDVAGVEDQYIQQLRRGLTEYRGAYYQDDPDEGFPAQKAGRKVAVYSIQGWTDDLFPAVESTRMFKLLKKMDPLWPVAVELADVGHPRSQNKPKTWQRLNSQAWQFLQANIQGSHEQQTTVASEQTLCPDEPDPDEPDQHDPHQDAAQRLTATSPEGLSNGSLSVKYASPGSINNPTGVADALDGFRSDPLAGGEGCKEAPGRPFPLEFAKYSATSPPLGEHSIYVGLGRVTLPQTTVDAPTATINVRVWDQLPDGKEERLIDRGTYRYDAPAYDKSPEDVTVPLFGNHFDLEKGHRLRLEVTLVDFPTFRPSNLASQVSFDRPTLTLPTREAGERDLAEAPAP